MIADNIRNRVKALCDINEAGNLTAENFILAMQGFMSDADLIEVIENAPISDARQYANAEGIIDFVAVKTERDARRWASEHGLQVIDPKGSGDPA